MKLPLLLTQFFYQNKRLNLPGIGSFTLDPAVTIPEDLDKNPHEIIQGVTYTNQAVAKADDELIDFIRLHTGKMKSLAEADLESYLTLGIQLLNIGKPFYFDGIGAVTKSQEGKYEFTPGEYVSFARQEPETEKKEKPDKRKSVFEEQHDTHQNQNNSSRKWLIALVLLGGLILIGWGGYTLYKKNTYPDMGNVPAADKAGSQKDTASPAAVPVSPAPDSVLPAKPPAAANPGKYDSGIYKFIILATDHKKRALRRYDQLISFDLKVKMDTKDSTFFKLYFSIPALPKDTNRIKDSLNRVYATKVLIEK